MTDFQKGFLLGYEGEQVLRQGVVEKTAEIWVENSIFCLLFLMWLNTSSTSSRKSHYRSKGASATYHELHFRCQGAKKIKCSRDNY